MILIFQLKCLRKQLPIIKNKKLLMHKKGVNMMNSCFESKEETPTDPIMKDFEEKNMESQCFVLGHRSHYIHYALNRSQYSHLLTIRTYDWKIAHECDETKHCTINFEIRRQRAIKNVGFEFIKFNLGE